jgi:hypothetical protein
MSTICFSNGSSGSLKAGNFLSNWATVRFQGIFCSMELLTGKFIIAEQFIPTQWWKESKLSSSRNYMASLSADLTIYLSINGGTALVDLGRLFSSLIYTQSIGLLGLRISPSQGRYLHTEQHKHNHASSRIRTHYPNVRAGGEGSCLRLRGHCDRHTQTYTISNKSLLQVLHPFLTCFLLRNWKLCYERCNHDLFMNLLCVRTQICHGWTLEYTLGYFEVLAYATIFSTWRF